MPVHVSATSQVPLAVRHTVVFGSNAFPGHVVLVPVQNSALSQVPADWRHTVVAGAGLATHPCVGLQLFVVHALPSSAHTTGVVVQPVLGLQLSVVHAFPSLHTKGGFEQPLLGLQMSWVQALLSAQLGGVPATQAPFDGLHVSTPLQTLPSPQLTGVPGWH